MDEGKLTKEEEDEEKAAAAALDEEHAHNEEVLKEKLQEATKQTQDDAKQKAIEEAELLRKDEHGNLLRSVDANHEKKIQSMMKEFGGDKPYAQQFG